MGLGLEEWKEIKVDGEVYRVKAIDSLRVVQLGCWVLKNFGAAASNAVATSEGLMGVLRSAVKAGLEAADDGTAVAEVATAKASKGMLDMLSAKLGDLVMSVGDAAQMMAANLTDEEIERGIKLLTFSVVLVPDAAGGALIQDLNTFKDITTPKMRRCGAMHPFKLLWELLKHHAGPTFGGEPGKTQSPPPVPAAT